MARNRGTTGKEFAGSICHSIELSRQMERGLERADRLAGDSHDQQLDETVTIRQQPLLVHEALHRSLATRATTFARSCTPGQQQRAERTGSTLSIPPGMSAAYNQAPTSEKPAAHQAALPNGVLEMSRAVRLSRWRTRESDPDSSGRPSDRRDRRTLPRSS